MKLKAAINVVFWMPTMLVSAANSMVGNPNALPPPEPCFSTSKVAEHQEYFGCRPKNRLFNNALCYPPAKDRDCEKYCESYVEWWYGREVHFNQTRCGPGACILKPGLTTEIKLPEWDSFVSKETYTVDSFFNYWTPNITAPSITLVKPTSMYYECGYFTFIPYMVREYLLAFKNGDETQEFRREVWDECLKWSMNKTVADTENELEEVIPPRFADVEY
ncbi:hypothetical protein G7Z17_g5406 [Cylindrodendrum hubeiense]|uniref:Uncharacterized protein n=1 Tax=Cylindrodendrum hubeiense TaxID=595255 RepID=A0A9P5HEY9_9HYPO|nr:hypothetical protein G7Z17_g5406 [Cylindrodendrum hubeiense]